MIDPDFKIRAVPDLFLSDGTVVHGQFPPSEVGKIVMRLRDIRTSIWNEAVEITLATALEGRMLTGGEGIRVGRLIAEVNDIDNWIRLLMT